MITFDIAGFKVALPSDFITLPGFEPFVTMGERSDDMVALMPRTKFAAWLDFARFSIPRGAIPIHASAVVHNGGAVLFLGESGTGKSTHTRLWLQHIADTRLLNDDSPIVRVTLAGDIVACGSPWSGKTHCYNNITVPLRAMVRLRQGHENRIVRLAGVHSIAAMWPSCPPQMAHDSALRGAMLDIVGHIVTQVPIFEMECRPDREAAIVAHGAVKNLEI
jgi:hypothetical protein